MENISGIDTTPDLDASFVYDDESALIETWTVETAEATGNEKPKKQTESDGLPVLEWELLSIFHPFPEVGKFKSNMSDYARQKQESRTKKQLVTNNIT